MDQRAPAMLTGLADGLLCCLLGRAPNVVGPLQPIESGDGYSFVEVKPGRVLRVKHVAPAWPPGAREEPPRTGAVRCKRRIAVYRSGQVVIENLVEAPGTPTAGGGPSLKRRRPKPKRVVHVDCTRRIGSCKGSHRDVALFFIHGVGGSSDIWKEQLAFFAGLGYEVVAPDLAGHGASSAPQIAAAYTFYALAEDLRSLFKRYAKKRNVLIGHSYGVSFCTFLAHEYPDLVHKVVMVNGGGPTALEPSLCSIFNMPPCVLRCLSPCLAWTFLKAGFARQGAKEKQLLKEGNAFNVSSFVLRAMMSGQYWPEGDEVYHAELTVPVLLVHGMHDKFVPVEEDQRMAEILLLAFLKVIDEGSHMVMLECPETVNTLLHEFLLWEPEPLPSEEGPPVGKK
uniref:Protein ABHD8 n=1 Tax=Laticauda laticaudata TaxID=8630 RepID=A0A8C5RRS1_LATLA